MSGPALATYRSIPVAVSCGRWWLSMDTFYNLLRSTTSIDGHHHQPIFTPTTSVAWLIKHTGSNISCHSIVIYACVRVLWSHQYVLPGTANEGHDNIVTSSKRCMVYREEELQRWLPPQQGGEYHEGEVYCFSLSVACSVVLCLIDYTLCV